MNNLFTTGLIAISIIALNGCKESVDLTAGTYRSTSSTATVSSTESQGTDGVIISTTAPVTVIKVVTVPKDETSQPTENTDTGNDSGGETGSNDTESDQPTETETETESSDPVTPETDLTPTTPSTSANCDVEATDALTPFVRVQLTYGLLSATSFVDGELGSIDSIIVTEDAAQNANAIKLESTIGLVSGQLITYVSDDGVNRVTKIDQVLADQVTIDPLQGAISAGSAISNFYNDPTHPNANGYKAVADFGIAYASPINPAQKHVLLGDSWFDDGRVNGSRDFEDRLKTRLSDATIVNAGIGGNTLCDLINRFDIDVAPEAPQYVWINSSINDAFNDVNGTDYKTRMQYLIAKVQSINATAIVFDPAPLNGSSFGGVNLMNYTYSYAGAVSDLADAAAGQ